jgi:hypothetical protein
MFDALKSLGKVAVNVVTAPVDIVADVITMGGAMNDRHEPYTVSKAKTIMKNIEDANK